MLDQDDNRHQQELLATYRQNLAHLIRQAAAYGGESLAPLLIVNAIHETRANILRIKAYLRAIEVAIEDHLDDEPASFSSVARESIYLPASPSATGMLRVFLCHASRDKPAVRVLYQQLKAKGFDPWLDDEKLLPGQDWQQVISSAVRDAHAVIVCLSRQSITKPGFVQKEIKYALDVADEQPEGGIFIIPLQLEPCTVPERLRRWHWVNGFDERGYHRLILALQRRAEELGITLSPTKDSQTNSEPLEAVDTPTSSEQLVTPIWAHPVPGENLLKRYMAKPVPPLIPRVFIAVYLVTNRDYTEFLDDPANTTWLPTHAIQSGALVDSQYLKHWRNDTYPTKLADHPVTHVSWNAAQAYIAWLGKQLGQPLYLPTQEEWEVAARAGRSQRQWWDDALRAEGFNCKKTSGRLSRVGEFDPNPFGLCDILGNVYELCAAPVASKQSASIIACGGSYEKEPDDVITPIYLTPCECRSDVGFRWARAVDGSARSDDA